MFKLGILLTIAIIALNLNGYQAKSLEGDFSNIPANQLMAKMLPLLDYIAKQSKCNTVNELTKSQTAMQKDNEERLIALQNQLTETHRVIEEQKSLLETFKDKLVRMETQLTSSPEILKKILEDFKVVTEPPKAIIIPHGFEKIGSRYFYIEEQSQYSWFDAQFVCREKGGYLAAFKDQEEFDAVLLKLSEKDRYWLGINDLNDMDVYISNASGKEAPFLKWVPGNPNSRDNYGYCVGVYLQAFANWPCVFNNKFICSLDNTV